MANKLHILNRRIQTAQTETLNTKSHDPDRAEIPISDTWRKRSYRNEVTVINDKATKATFRFRAMMASSGDPISSRADWLIKWLQGRSIRRKQRTRQEKIGVPRGLRAYGKVKLISLRSVIFDYIVVLIIYWWFIARWQMTNLLRFYFHLITKTHKNDML